MDASTELARIGEIAERLGISTRTIKYYEELGLVEPGARSEGGFRLYRDKDVERLQRILRMKRMGFSLAAIRELLEVRDEAQEEMTRTAALSRTMEHLKEREGELEGRIEEMREDLRRAEALREELGRDIELCNRRIEELQSGQEG